ncbi:MAG: hypothetical protein RL660_2651 [Bacteroidota bacterium]|jgi:hypothetical protein
MKKDFACKNCNTNFTGNFCNNCGEKVLKDSDFAFKKIFSQALDSFTHLDSKLFKTLRLLLFSPGKISKLYIEGIRVPYMKPFQIFVICNIVFFIIFANDDIFRVPSAYFFKSNYDGIAVLDKVKRIASATGNSETEIAASYDAVSTNLAKGLLVLLIPIIASIGKLLNSKRKMEFGKHLIFATHFLTTFLLLFMIASLFLRITTSTTIKSVVLGLLALAIFAYYAMSIKQFYGNTLSTAFMKGAVGIILIAILVSIYKLLISILALYLQ